MTQVKKFAELLESKINEAIDKYNTDFDKNIDKIGISTDTKKLSITSGSTDGASNVLLTTSATVANNLANV